MVYLLMVRLCVWSAHVSTGGEYVSVQALLWTKMCDCGDERERVVISCEIVHSVKNVFGMSCDTVHSVHSVKNEFCMSYERVQTVFTV